MVFRMISVFAYSKSGSHLFVVVGCCAIYVLLSVFQVTARFDGALPLWGISELKSNAVGKATDTGNFRHVDHDHRYGTPLRSPRCLPGKIFLHAVTYDSCPTFVARGYLVWRSLARRFKDLSSSTGAPFSFSPVRGPAILRSVAVGMGREVRDRGRQRGEGIRHLGDGAQGQLRVPQVRLRADEAVRGREVQPSHLLPRRQLQGQGRRRLCCCLLLLLLLLSLWLLISSASCGCFCC